MRTATKEMLDRLRAIDWFGNCGEFMDESYVYAKTKEEAIRRFVSKDWYNFTVPISNRFQAELLKKFGHPDTYRGICMEVCGTTTDRFVAELHDLVTERLVDNKDLINEVESALRLDVSGILAEAEFSNVIQPFFYLPVILRIYEAGHLPCGWTGRIPNYNWNGTSLAEIGSGQIVVF